MQPPLPGFLSPNLLFFALGFNAVVFAVRELSQNNISHLAPCYSVTDLAVIGDGPPAPLIAEQANVSADFLRGKIHGAADKIVGVELECGRFVHL